jgi:diaminopimelate decarboxylase
MGNLIQSLIDKHFATLNGELLVGAVGVSALAEKFGTPSFLYDCKVFDKKLDELRGALPPSFSVCYSVKANPNPLVLRHFLSRGCGLEIASVGEFNRGLEAGCPPELMLFAGPGKTVAELEAVIAGGIGEIHLESTTEAHRVSSISRRLGVRTRVALRVNPSAEAEGGAMRMGGRPTPFGMDEEILGSVLDLILENEALEFRGIHLFTGTQILDAKLLVNQYRHGLAIARRVVIRIGAPIKRLDFGGGIGIPYFPHEKELDLTELRSALSTIFTEIESDPAFSGTEFLVEPGRFLAGEAGVYLARINDIKVSRGKKFIVLDGGMNHHLAASGNLGQTIKRNYPVALLNKLNAEPAEVVDVVGPLCTPLDTLARNVTLPRAEIGDLFGIFQSGAYGLSASPMGFLSHPIPAEVFVSNGEARLALAASPCAEGSVRSSFEGSSVTSDSSNL